MSKLVIFFRVSLLVVFCIVGQAIGQSPEIISVPKSPQLEIKGQLTLPVILTGKKGELIKDLPITRFAVFVDKAQQQITSFEQQDQPVSVGILLDCSTSLMPVITNNLNQIAEGLKLFSQRANPESEYALFTFNLKLTVKQEWTTQVQGVLQGLGTIDKQSFDAGTNFYDACFDVLERLRTRRNSKKAIIVITDGEDNGSQRKLVDVRKLGFESQTLVLLY